MNDRIPGRRPLLAVFFAASLAGTAGHAATEGFTAQGLPYVTGGISRGERETLGSRRGDFSLWVVTAAKKSGAFLADVQVRITDRSGKVVLDTRMDGPWLLVALGAGEYQVETRHDSQTRVKTTRIHSVDRHEMMFYFDVQAEVLPPGENR